MIGHNDSGDTNRVFKMNLNADLIEEVYIPEAIHIDWEDVATDAYQDHLYIGDFGSNNFNFDRYERKIIKVEINSLFEPVNVREINFSFEDYSISPSHLNFDCEAMLIHEENIVLFTKNHGSSGYSKVYKLNITDSLQMAMLVDSFQTTYKVTGADIFLERVAVLTEGSIILGTINGSEQIIWDDPINLPFAKYEAITYLNKDEVLIARDGESQELLIVSIKKPIEPEFEEIYFNSDGNLVIAMNPDFAEPINKFSLHSLSGQLLWSSEVNDCCQYYTFQTNHLSSQSMILEISTAVKRRYRKIIAVKTN